MNEVKELSKSQRGFLTAIRQKHNMAFEAEINGAVRDIIEELGHGEDLKTNKIEVMLSNDYTKVTIVPRPVAPVAKPQPLPKIPKKLKK